MSLAGLNCPLANGELHMHATSGWKRLRRTALPLGVVVALGVLGFTLLAPAADHRDGPIFGSSTRTNGVQDINDVYVFTSPRNPANTVLAFTFQPFPGLLTPAFFSKDQYYDLKIDNTGDAVEDITFRVQFGPVAATGVQPVTLRMLPAGQFAPNGILAEGLVGRNLLVRGGGVFRADNFDDPFFFDATAFKELVEGERTLAKADNTPADPTKPVYPRPPAKDPSQPNMPSGGDLDPTSEARNFFLRANTLGFVLELPTQRLLGTNGTMIGVWGRIFKGGQPDRMGRPAINTALIPPVPRPGGKPATGPNAPPNAAVDLRNDFNAAQPRNDVRRFKRPMMSVMQNFYGLTPQQAEGLTKLLLPDILTFDTSKPFVQNVAGDDSASAFPNGRQPRDPVIHVELALLTQNFPALGLKPITTDNVNDDNGTRITDGTNGAPVHFPYLGRPNVPQGNIQNAK